MLPLHVSVMVTHQSTLVAIDAKWTVCDSKSFTDRTLLCHAGKILFDPFKSGTVAPQQGADCCTAPKNPLRVLGCVATAGTLRGLNVLCLPMD